MNVPDITTLPAEAAELAHRMHAGEQLGAMRNLTSIGSVLATVASQHGDSDALDRVIEYFRRTRGSVTQAVANGLDLLAHDLPADGTAACLERRASWLQEANDRWNLAIAEAAIDAIGQHATVVAFDYSSVVSAVLQHGHDRRGWRIVVPESRALDGGRPFVDELGPVAISSVVPDVAMGRSIRDADAVLIGAETFFADGSCHNTLGSLTAALCAAQLQTAFHVATPLLKYAGATVAASECSGSRDFADRFGRVPGADTLQPENERVPGELITSYFTEVGTTGAAEIARVAATGLVETRDALAGA